MSLRQSVSHPASGLVKGAPRIDGWSVGALLLAALAAVPIVTILVSAPSGGFEAIAHLARTVLGSYILNTLALMAMAGGLALVVGTGCAWLVSAARFPGRSVFAWALVLPLALPAYIAAYLYGDLLDFTGPVQTALREATGLGVGDYWLPKIRSLPGGAFVLGIVLYPYVYLLARASFAAQSVSQFRAARSLGAKPTRAFWQVALPAARPAIAGGLALVLMEVLADFGVAQYFAIPTFSTGIFRSWLAMGDKQAALKLAAMMLLFVIALIVLEASTRQGRSASKDARPDDEPLVHLSPVGKGLATIACLIPVLLGFVIPAIYLLTMSVSDAAVGRDGRFVVLCKRKLVAGSWRSIRLRYRSAPSRLCQNPLGQRRGQSLDPCLHPWLCPARRAFGCGPARTAWRCRCGAQPLCPRCAGLFRRAYSHGHRRDPDLRALSALSYRCLQQRRWRDEQDPPLACRCRPIIGGRPRATPDTHLRPAP